MEKTGRCLCGAVTYVARGVESECGACHCDMCRRWTGGLLMAVKAEEITWQGTDQLRTHPSSEWAERGFCSVCGSGLFYRITIAGPHQGQTNIAVGTLDDPSGLSLSRELFIDRKPSTYALAGERARLTEAEVMAMFASPDAT